MTAWLNVVGIGEDGLDALSPAARTLVETAQVLVGGERHLGMVPTGRAKRLAWRKPLRASFADLAAHEGERVTVLASGDPTWFGVGSALAQAFGAERVHIVPAPGAFSLACARLGWARQAVTCLSLHGQSMAARRLASLRLHLRPGARLLVLAEDGGTPAAVARLLTDAGYGDSTVTVLAHLGGAGESIDAGPAHGFGDRQMPDLNTIAVACAGPPGMSRVPGLPDDAFEHDGQMTKRAVRAATLALLAPVAGEHLWDLGAGCGSVAVEWLRALGADGSAHALEQSPERCAVIARNADRLGVPHLETVQAVLPAGIDGLRRPDAIFVGGGLKVPALFETCRGYGCRLVANAVTVEGEAVLLDQYQRHGGNLRRLSVSEAAAVGTRTGWRPGMPVTQYWWQP